GTGFVIQYRKNCGPLGIDGNPTVLENRALRQFPTPQELWECYKKYNGIETSFSGSSAGSLRYENRKHAFPHPGGKAANVAFWDGHVANVTFTVPNFGVDAIKLGNKSSNRNEKDPTNHVDWLHYNVLK
ncbi:MAG: hypothetical protein J6R86_00540, partial [Lentisphaeria bacterium]|nr:hypothetical protein [Lentisphaeria bacterium]